MSKKKEMEVFHKAESVAFALKDHGIAHVSNDEPGFCSQVESELRRRYPTSDLVVDYPPRDFGGEYTFRSASHLGTKPESGAE